MKICVKKEDYETVVPLIIASFVFIVGSITGAICIITDDPKFTTKTVWLLFIVLSCLAFGLFILFFLVKSPKKYRALLTYKGRIKDITYMQFDVYSKYKNKYRLLYENLKGFTYGDNELIVNKEYDIYIKEINQKIKRVDNIDNEEVLVSGNIIDENDIKKEESSYTKYIDIYCVGAINLTLILVAVVGIIKYKEYIVDYIKIIVFLTVGTIGYIFLNHYFRNNYDVDDINKDDDDINKDDDDIDKDDDDTKK